MRLPTPGARRGTLLALKGLISFRVLMALATSASVTAAVAGPMAYQAARARDAVVIAAPASTTTTTTSAPDAPIVTPASTTSTSSSTTTTTTTAAPPVRPTVSTTTIAPTTTASPITATGLLSSNRADHSGPLPIDGALLYARTWLFFDGSGVLSVSFWLDDPTASGPADRVAPGPFDVDPNGVDVSALGVGTHTLVAEVTTLDGTYRRSATFTVIG